MQHTGPPQNFTIEFYPRKFQFKMGNRASQTQKQGASESQSLTITPARVMYIQNSQLQVCN